MRRIIVFLLLISLLPVVIAQENEVYHLPILAVQETEEGFTGSVADLYLELKEGSGRVFLDTFPLTKADTQISTRFAKDVACNYYDLPCERYDFIYTIKAKSNIIGGPSASAAIAALTTIAVLDMEYSENMTITATINSGGIIGPVGGVKEKLDAADKFGLKKILIAQGNVIQKPYLSMDNSSRNNESINLLEYGRENLNIEVVEVEELDDVIFHLTGKKLNSKEVALTENEEYNRIMNQLQEILCGRMEKIGQEITAENIRFNQTIQESIASRKAQLANATSQGDYYSAASFCFGTNIQLKSEFYQQKQLSERVVARLFQSLQQKTEDLEQKIEQQEVNTISDLQTFIVVKERINEVKEQIKRYNEGSNDTIVEPYGLLAYAEERFFSAVSWMEFFAMEGKEFVVNQDLLQEGCQKKISEAEERYNYAVLFVTEEHLKQIREEISTAQSALEQNELELCLIKAAQAKAEANAILSSLGLTEETIGDFVEAKKKAVERVIAENSEEGIFPILGYSYYQYALSLRGEDQFTALVYLEYALEMSDLDLYFPEKEEWGEKALQIDFAALIYLIAGLIIGALLMFLIMSVRRKRTRRKT